MNQINISKQITRLRKKVGLTQEQLAQALSVSPQAVSKWETDASQPDIMTLPLIARYFDVSIDYLFYGSDMVYGDVYGQNMKKVSAYGQMSREAYEEVHRIFSAADCGLFHKKTLDMPDCPYHISNENGLSLYSKKGYGAIVTKDFFSCINRNTAAFSAPFLSLLSDETRLLVCMAIVSMSDISFGELSERLSLSGETLRRALDELIAGGLVIEKKSKHKSLELTYEIAEFYHTCLCILLATLQMEKESLKGISCCMGYGDYPIQF